MQNLMFDDSLDIQPIIKELSNIPTSYVGNKRKIIGNIWTIIEKEKIKFESIIDLFSGSGIVSYFMKRIGKKVISNDLLTSSFMKTLTLIENPGIKLSLEEIKYLMEHQNKDKSAFIQNRWGNKYVTENESIFLDNFRANVNDIPCLYKQSLGMVGNNSFMSRLPWGGIDKGVDLSKHRHRQMENYGKDSENHDRRIGIYWDDKLEMNFVKWIPKYIKDFSDTLDDKYIGALKQSNALDSLSSNVLKHCFVGGRLYSGQVIAEMNHRLNHAKNNNQEIDLNKTADIINQNNRMIRDNGCIALNWDAIELMKSGMIKTDMAYIDPPYGGSSSNYAYMYQFLEEYIYSKPIDEIDHIQKYAFRFTKNKDYESNFMELIDSCKDIKTLIISYNDSSWSSLEKITEILESMNREVKTYEIDGYTYNYRKNKNSKKGTELVIICYKI